MRDTKDATSFTLLSHNDDGTTTVVDRFPVRKNLGNRDHEIRRAYTDATFWKTALQPEARKHGVRFYEVRPNFPKVAR